MNILQNIENKTLIEICKLTFQNFNINNNEYNQKSKIKTMVFHYTKNLNNININEASNDYTKLLNNQIKNLKYYNILIIEPIIIGPQVIHEILHESFPLLTKFQITYQYEKPLS